MTYFEEICGLLGISEGTEAEESLKDIVNELIFKGVPFEEISRIAVARFKEIYK